MPSARRSSPSASSGSARCRRRGRRRSSGAPCARACSARIPAICPRSRTPNAWRRSAVPLSGRALVTGGGRGIGENIARELADAGMRVIVTGRTQEQVGAVAREIGGRALVGDVASRQDVERWADEAGEVDLLVCNAGMSGLETPLGDPAEWWRTFEVNMLGLYLCCNAFAPGMVERGGGRIVNIASGAAYQPPRREGQPSAYGASKAAVHRFSELLAADLAPKDVFV